MQEISINEYMEQNKIEKGIIESEDNEINEEEKFEELKRKVEKLTKQLDLSIAISKKKHEELVLSERRINALEEELRNLRKNKNIK